jgi:hypothetical protein
MFQAEPRAPKNPPVLPVPATLTNTWDDPEGHYIVKPDDIIGHKCEYLPCYSCG